MKIKEKTKISKAVKAVIIVLVLAFVFAGAAYLTIYLSGYRVVRYQSPDGETRFLGKVDKNGQPQSGTVYFADGRRAQLDLKNNKIEYSDDSVYVGQTKELLPDGKGKLTFVNGESYEGDFVAGEMTGYGTYIYSPAIGDKYEGFLKNGKREGKGKYTWSDGSYYEGGFKDDMKHGEGTFIWANGASYKGTFVNDVKDGRGVYVFANGDKYEGDFVSDVRTGTGTYTWQNGEYYTGEFKNNMMDGRGTYYWTSGRSYEGTFKENKIVWELS